MNKNEKYCFIAFGELALDVVYNENGIIRESGGVSAFNTLYNLGILGEEAYAICGTGNDINGIKTINSLKEGSVNTKYVQILDKPTNVFYIFKPKEVRTDEDVEIGRTSPITGKSTIEWSDKINTDFPKEFENRNLILIVSNFEPVTDRFIKNTKHKNKNAKVSLDITNGKIFEKYSKEYLLEYLKQFDFVQCNINTGKIICEKLGFSSFEELYSNLNAEIFTVTEKERGATFYYKDKDDKKTVYKPKKIAKLVDPTGAGDAFHSILLMSYCRMKYLGNRIDKKYFDRAFNIANMFARKIVGIEGARGKQEEVLDYMISEMENDDEIEK